MRRGVQVQNVSMKTYFFFLFFFLWNRMIVRPPLARNARHSNASNVRDISFKT